MKIVIVGNGPAAIRALEAIATNKTVPNAEERKLVLYIGSTLGRGKGMDSMD